MANALRNVNPVAVTICKTGANGKTFFLRKMQEGEKAIVLPSPQTLIKSDDDWTVAYCVVAEPGAEEQRGMIMKGGELVMDPDPEPDFWENEDEVRSAAHRFMKNGGLITKMHESIEDYGDLVESAVALEDFDINGEEIKKGSWYIGIAPNDHGKQAIESGEFTGVSLEGTGERVQIAKATEDEADDTAALQEELVKSSPLIARILKAIGFPPASITHNGKPIGSESGTVDSTATQEDDDVADDKRIEAVEGKVDTLAKSVDALTERLGKVLDAAEDKKPPTIEDLNKSVDDLAEGLDKVMKGVDALAQGTTSQGGTDTNGHQDLSDDEKYARSLLGVE